MLNNYPNFNQTKLKELKNLRNNVNWEIEKERHIFRRKLYILINYGWSPLPNLRDIFRTEEIDWLLVESVKSLKPGNYERNPEPLINFLIRSRYKDEPDVGEDGKPLFHRTTPVHHAARSGKNYIIPDLFKIYDRFDVNYTDENGLAHFHIACKNNCDDVVQKFLDLGEDPNCLEQGTDNSPLHLAAENNCNKVIKLLLRRGANPNLANKDGLTLMHIICKKGSLLRYLLWMAYLEFCDAKYQPVQVDIRDKFGLTPLYYALAGNVIKDNCIGLELLKRGANPNVADADGLTPLHFICRRTFDFGFAEKFFKICDEKHQMVQVDVKDKLGRTPLQLAVANLLPNKVDALLNYGADVHSVVFPAASDFVEKFKAQRYKTEHRSKLGLASRALIVVELLEKRGYELDQSDASTIMKFFVEYGMLAKSADLEKYLYDDEEFASKVKEIMVIPSLSLYDLIRLRPEKATKLLTPTDYFELTKYTKLTLRKKYRDVICDVHMSEKVSRRFFQRWAVNSFLELTHYQLPILCCEKIMEKLKTEVLWRIFLAATGQSS